MERAPAKCGKMPRKKRSKGKKKSKKSAEELSVIIDDVEVLSNGEVSDPKSVPKGISDNKKKSSKEVYFAFLPDKYEPLTEDEADEDAEWREEKEKKISLKKEEKERKNILKKEKHKKYRQNVGKALRFGWKCLVAGLHSFAGAYGMPLSAASTVVGDVHRANRKA